MGHTYRVLTYHKGKTMNLQTLTNLRDALSVIRSEAPELPIQQLQVFVLVSLNEGITARSLENMTGMTQTSIGRNVNALTKYAGAGREGLAWLEWRTDPKDLRSKPLYLTEKGKEVLAKITNKLER